MADQIRKVEYYYTLLDDKPGEAFRVLQALKERGVNLIAATAFPVEKGRSQLDLFPEKPGELKTAAASNNISLTGPKWAFVAQGDDRPGALADIHRRLSEANVNVHAANGVSNGRGGFGYVLWVRPEHVDAAARALGV